MRMTVRYLSKRGFTMKYNFFMKKSLRAENNGILVEKTILLRKGSNAKEEKEAAERICRRRSTDNRICREKSGVWSCKAPADSEMNTTLGYAA